jgi:Ca2+-binding EF-hand superfamily protein
MMKITKLTIPAISAALAMIMTASAENSDKKGKRLGGEGKRELPQRILEKFDTDGDGMLNESEKSELKKAITQRRGENQAKMLKRFDSDKDGTLSTEEKKAAIPTIKKERKAIHEAALKQFDKDGDGKLSPEEREGVREWVKETYPNAIKMAPAGGRRGNKAGSAPKKGPKGSGQAAE